MQFFVNILLKSEINRVNTLFFKVEFYINGQIYIFFLTIKNYIHQLKKGIKMLTENNEDSIGQKIAKKMVNKYISYSGGPVSVKIKNEFTAMAFDFADFIDSNNLEYVDVVNFLNIVTLELNEIKKEF